MGIVFSHTTALESLRSASRSMDCAYIENQHLRPHDFTRAGAKVLHGSLTANAIADCQMLRYEEHAEPLHVLVRNTRQLHHMKGVHLHVCSSPIGTAALVQSYPGEWVCGPELCFVQLAAQLSLHEAIRLGFELCGTYALVRDVAFTSEAATPGFCRRDPLTTPARIASFLATANLHGGVKRARMALKHILPGAASPMETIVSMLLSLPVRRGGYGLPGPKLNWLIKGRSAGRRIAYICDLYWPDGANGHGVAIEYDSDQWHAGKERIARDSKKRTDLGNMGVEVISVTWDQVRDRIAMDGVAQLLAKRLGVRLRPTNSNSEQARQTLRRELLTFQ